MAERPSPNFLHRMVQKVSSSAWGAGFLSVVLNPLDQLAMRLTGGKSSLTEVFAGQAVYTLTSRGAKSGLERKVTLLGFPDGDKVFLIASNWGKANYPSWYHNLKANPEASLTFNGKTAVYRAYEAEGEEREAGWEKAVAAYGGYENYKARTAGRIIPVMVLTPVED